MRGEGPNLLLIEDDPKSVVMIQRALRKHSLQARMQVVTDGQQARDYIEGRNAFADRGQFPFPDLVLLDLHLPDEDGLDLLAWIKSQCDLSSLPVAILTVSSEADVIERALRQGAMGYLIKPIATEALAELVLSVRLDSTGQPRVLLVDDDPRVRSLVLRELRHDLVDSQLVSASNKAECDAILQQGGFDLALIDHDLPWTDGLTLVRVIKTRWPDCPAIMLTASGDEQTAAAGMRVGLDDYILKSPTHMARLRGAVRLLLGRARLEKSQKEAQAALADSERRYRRLFESALEGIILVDAETLTIVDVNPALSAILGYSREELIGQRPWMLAPDDESESRRIGMIALATTPQRKRDVANLRRADGTQIVVERESLSYTVGDRRLVQCHIRDVTEAQKAQEALERSEQQLRAVIDASPFPVAMVDEQDQVIAYWSESARRLFGHTAPMVPEWYEMAYPDPAYRREVISRWKAHLEQARASGEAVNTGEYRVTCSDGSERTCELHAAFVAGSLVVTFSDVTEHRKAEEALAESERRFRTIIESSPDASFVVDQDGNYTYANAAACSMLGYSLAELLELNVADVNAEEAGHAGPSKTFIRLLQQGRLHTEMELRRCDGTMVPVDLSAVVLPNGTAFASCRDISERKQHEAEMESLELQLRQAQKMEAIGQLAGGVAHDFNNMLGVIVGHAEMALEETSAEDAIHANLQEIMAAAKRSADLTRQLLAFARKQTIAPVVQDLNATVESALRMLRRLVGEDIEVVWQPHAPLWPVRIDSGQVGQMLTNLVLNARDAIGGLGRIVIETGQVSSNRDDCDGQAERVPGDYVMLAVSDDGCGMDASVQAHLFEPFFTTKPVGQGTGLGLATVYGIVKQNHGFIDVDSEPGTGTTIRIYVPRTLEGTSNHEPQPAADLKGGAGETILLVEDEPAILRITQRMLESAGYTVLGAGSPSAALQMAAEYGEPIDLLITDVVMPSMSGKDLAEQLRSMQPGLACLFMSGYTANIIEDRGVLEGGVQFLSKPFTSRVLADKVRKVLDGVR